MITVRLSKRFMISSPLIVSSSGGEVVTAIRAVANGPRAPPLPLDAMSTSDLLRMCGADKAWWRHDTGCDLVERVVGKKVRAAASILRVDGGHQCSFLRGVVRGPLA